MAPCCSEGRRLQDAVVDAIDDAVLAGALAADSDAYITAAAAYQAHRATHRSPNPPPSEQRGVMPAMDGGGVAQRGALPVAEGASPMTPEEPCWLESELNSGESLKGQICVLDGDIEAHTGEHESRALRCQDIRPCPACRVRELEAAIEGMRQTVARYKTFVEKVAVWREAAHAYDEDIGTSPRPFNDSEEWDNVETLAKKTLVDTRAALKEAK